MDYEEIVDYILKLPKFTKKNGLEHTCTLLERLGNPQEDFFVVHVAGSNGKGSVCAFIHSVFLEAGYSVGLFTSPHLVDIRERFLIDGKYCSKGQFVKAWELVQGTVEEMLAEHYAHPTFFEVLFAMAMIMFSKANVAYAVLETGLGGRLDATNTVKHPDMSVITSISLEHTEQLGDTVEKIAAEKAGIIKQGVPVVFDGALQTVANVIRGYANSVQAPVIEVKPMDINILLNDGKKIDFCFRTGYDITNGTTSSIESCFGTTRVQIPFGAEYQVQNAAVALAAILYLQNKAGFSKEEIVKGFLHVKWDGRMQEVLPEVYFDGCHNTAGIKAFLKEAKRMVNQPAVLLFSMAMEKNYKESIQMICSLNLWKDIIVTAIPNVRGVKAQELERIFAEECGKTRRVHCIEEVAKAYETALELKQAGQHLFCIGSLYLIGELKRIQDKRR
ncbi:bifunctional folylpolyglutamate synthase/dihydrofolate synthase [Lachnospiraceae bacterium ZAX-1]